MPHFPADSHARRYIAVFLCIAGAIAVVLLAFYRYLYEDARHDALEALQAMAELRAEQIARWRQERIGDGEILRRSRESLAGLERWLQHGGDGAHLRYWMRGYVDAFDYDSIQILGRDGDTRFLAGAEHRISPASRRLIAAAREHGFVVLGDMQYRADGAPYMDLVIPVPLAGEDWAIDTVLLRIDPAQYLDSLLRDDVHPGTTTESMLLRDDGDTLRFVLAPRSLPPHAAPPQVDRADAVSVLAAAARGEPAGEGLDHRAGPPVFAASARVAGSDWLLVSKVDQAEVLAPLHRRMFGAALLSLALLLGAAYALNRVWRRQQAETQRRLESERESRAELERLRNHLTETMKVAQLGSWERGLTTGEVWWSDQTRTLLQVPPGEAPSLEGFLARVHPDDRERVANALHTCYTSGVATETRYRVVLPDGSMRHFYNRVRVEADAAGRPSHALGTLQDITSQQTIERELQRQTACLLAIVNHLPQGISVFDEQLRLQYWNARFAEVLELPPHLLYSGVAFDDLIMVPALRGEYGPGDPATHVAQRRELALRFEAHRFERTRPNGTTHLVAGEPLFIDGAVAGFITTYTDITERKRIEEALAQRHRLLQTIIDNIPGGVSLVGPSLQLLACNEELKHLLNFPPELFADGLPNLETLLRYNAERGEYGPGDPEAITQTLLARAHTAAAHSFERVRPDGRVLHVQGQPLPDGGFVTIYTDITARKRAERQLLLADSVFRHSPEAIVVTDLAHRILSVNPAFSTITGFRPQDVLDTEFLPCGADGDADTHLRSATVWAVVEASGTFAGETEGMRENGEHYPRWLTINAVRDEHTRQVTHHVAIFTDITERKRSEANIQHLAQHDPLTGLANRFSLGARLEQALADARRNGQRLAVLFLDLDHFKHINDSLGHHIGDELLIQVARRLRDTVRDTDNVARLGGDEFVVVLQGVRDSADALQVAAKILAELSAPYAVGDAELHTAPSIGISLFPHDGDTPAALMRNADTAMYHAKALGRANYQFYTEEMNRAATARLNLEHKLRRALARGEFELWYQPQFAAADGHLCGLEALLRWRHPDDGLIAPAHFIPQAEESGLIVPIGRWAMHEACRQARSWLQAGLPALRMSVNLSVRQLRDAQLGETVAAVLAETGLPPAQLELEITESSVMQRPGEAIALLESLKALGVALAIDDFGTGHSSLSYLKLFPLDHLKIDRSFVSDIEHDANDAAIVAAAVSLAHNLGLSVVAEGVESAEQLARLRELGCDEVQGYHFSRPLPAAEAEGFIRRQCMAAQERTQA